MRIKFAKKTIKTGVVYLTTFGLLAGMLVCRSALAAKPVYALPAAPASLPFDVIFEPHVPDLVAEKGAVATNAVQPASDLSAAFASDALGGANTASGLLKDGSASMYSVVGGATKPVQTLRKNWAAKSAVPNNWQKLPQAQAATSSQGQTVLPSSQGQTALPMAQGQISPEPQLGGVSANSNAATVTQDAADKTSSRAYPVYTAPLLSGDGIDDIWGAEVPLASNQPIITKMTPDPTILPLEVMPDGAAHNLNQAEKENSLLASVEPVPLSNMYLPLLPAADNDGVMPQFLPIYINHEFTNLPDHLNRAVIFIHDLNRNAAAGFSDLKMLAGTADKSTLLLAPQFPLGIDIVRNAAFLPDNGQHIARWSLTNLAQSWQFGGYSVAQGRGGISSFTVIDYLLLFLADKSRFPELKTVVLAGHGMGGDFVQRYAAIGKATSFLADKGMKLSFLVADANSYLYLTPQRGMEKNNSAFIQKSLAAPSPQPKCEGYNDYPYGLEHLTGYARKIGGNEIKSNYAPRIITYLVTANLQGDPLLDESCAALEQGKTRLKRAQNFALHLARFYGDLTGQSQIFVKVAGNKYDALGPFSSTCGLSVLFGVGSCQGRP